MLYAADATVYIACRTESKALKAIDDIRAAAPESRGRLEFIRLDLGDLRTVKPAAEAFLAKETRLHVLFNNAGVMTPANETKTAQGYDMQLGTNCLGPFLLTQLLTPALRATVAAGDDAPRVVWVASIAAEVHSQRPYGIDMANVRGKDFVKVPDIMTRYGISKCGNFLHSAEYARRHKADGIISVVRWPHPLGHGLW